MKTMILNKIKNCIPNFYCLGMTATIMLLVGCSLSDSNNNNSITASPDPELAVTRIMVDIGPIPDSLVEATPAPSLIAVEELPEEFKMLGKNEQCVRSCMYGIELGQTMEEAIQAIRDNPQTDTTRIYQDGDYIDVYPTNDIDGSAAKGISWQIKIDTSDKYAELLFPGRGSIFTKDNYVYNVGIRRVNSVIPISLIIEEYGNPRYIQTVYMSSNEVLFHLIYLLPDAAYLRFRVSGKGSPPMLSEYSPIESVSIGELDSFFGSICSPLYDISVQEWQGFGGLDTYYNHEGERIGTIPFDC